MDINQINDTTENATNTAENKELLNVKSLSTLIKERFLIQNISFALNKGDIFGIVGEKQSGKTSLLKAIAGALPITEGTIFFDGQDLHKNKKLTSNITISLDPPVFFKYQTVYDNIKFLSSLKGKFNKQKTLEILQIFDLLDKKDEKVRTLTYHEKKKMALALALVTKPKLVLLDEPFKGLNDKYKEEITSKIKELSKIGVGVIITSSAVEDIENLCTRFIFMGERKIKKEMSASELKGFDTQIEYTFIKTKYPNYGGKLLIDNFNKKVKLLGNKILLMDEDDDNVARMIKFLTSKKVIVYSAGKISNKAEQIFASLSSYYKEEDQ